MEELFFKKNRRVLSVLLVLSVIGNLLVGMSLDSISKADAYVVFIFSVLFLLEVISFLYDRPMRFSGARYPVDSSKGRVIFAAIFFFCFIFVQIYPYFID